MSTKASKTPAELDDTTMEEEDLATHQETIPVPFVFGTRLVALRWISPALDMVTRQAKDDKPGKK